MPRLRVNTPLWLRPHAAARARRYPTLEKDVDADVAIVGGGITGAALAWRFADADVSVALVEAASIGRGSTAASTALLMQEPDADLVELTRRYGGARAKRIWQLSLVATRDFISTLERLRVECNLVRRDSLYYTANDEDVPRLREELRKRAAAGLDARWMEGALLHRALRFRAAAAIRTRGNAQVDPFAACVGLVHAAAQAGARIFERSPVLSIQASKSGVRIRTSAGAIRAHRVIVATGYATPYFKQLSARFRMLNTYVVATRPLTPAERRRVGPGDVMVWDTGKPYHYARWTSDHRLLLGGRDRDAVPERHRQRALEEGARGVHADFTKLYPGLAEIEIDHRWEGLFAATPDGLPYIGPHRRYARHLFALGYGGNGMTFGFLAARLLLDWYRGDRSPDHALFAFSR